MSTPAEKNATGRLLSLDAYRGFTMLAMASGGLGFAQASVESPDNQLLSALALQLDHVPWRGGVFWDLIQPSFMFIVGVAMPFSHAARAAHGQSWNRQLVHAVIRSAILVALGVFLASAWSARTNYTFTNVLAQIGLGYTFVFLILDLRPTTQLAIALAILAGYWLLFALYPAPTVVFDFASVGAPTSLTPMDGLAAHWNMNSNAAWAFDVWFLNLFPHSADGPFRFNPGGYATLNFVPSIATMIAGVLAGELLRSPRSGPSKVQTLVIAGALCIAMGFALNATLCPIVKRIWTPSWVIYSAGWTCGLLALFYGLIDVAGFRRWSFPLVVVGMNSIAIYMMAQLMKPFIASSLTTHFGGLWKAFAANPAVDRYVYTKFHEHLPDVLFQGLYGPMLRSVATLLVLWLICLWLYRQKIFVKI
jgi:predicted acyltransferase